MTNNETEFTVRGIESESDARTIDDELTDLEGVQMVSVDGERGQVAVRYGGELIAEQAIESAVQDLGYEVE